VTAAMSTGDCAYCGLLTTGPDGGWILEDSRWVVAGHPLHDVPGAALCILRRHVERLADLEQDELQSMGELAAKLSSAIEGAVVAEKVYLVMFLEQNAHFHFLLLADASEAERVTSTLRAGFTLREDEDDE
jgi:diadenosine tetraphosphate (Ap4A) HIT family hydrolase